MSADRPAIVDGRWAGDGCIALSLVGPGIHMGRGLFETLRREEGRLAFAERHHRRMRASAQALGLPEPAPLATFCAESAALPVQAPRERVRWVFLLDGAGAHRAITAEALAPPPLVGPELWPLPWRTAGARPFPEHKTINWMGPWRALELAPAGTEPVFAADDGTWIEAARANLVVIDAHGAKTPGTRRGALAGVGLAVLCDASAQIGLPWREEAIDPCAVSGWQDVLLVSALRGVQPVRRAAGRSFGSPGPAAVALARAFEAIARSELGLAAGSDGFRPSSP